MSVCKGDLPSNIVEGCARDTEADYLRFLDRAYRSVGELEYDISLAQRLGYLDGAPHERIAAVCAEAYKVLNGLIG